MGRLAGRSHDNATRIKVNVTEQLGLFWKIGNDGLLGNRSSSVVQALNSGATSRVNKHIYTSFSSSINEDCPAFTCVIEKEIA